MNGSTNDRSGTQAVLIALGANLPGPLGPPKTTLSAALVALEQAGVKILQRSRWWKTAPVPVSDQPWFVNGVAEVETDLAAPDLMALLHQVEQQFGRVRSIPNAARIIDLDLLALGREQRAEGPVLPHPRLHERAFVLFPLRDLFPDWRHPVSGESLAQMVAALPPGQEILPDEG